MSFFRTPINPEVQKELFRRIEGITREVEQVSHQSVQIIKNSF